jgi:hypothetical protein
MKKASVLNNRDFKYCLKFFRVCQFRSDGPSCLAGYFTWPQVALTHHVCHRCLYAPRAAAVKRDYLHNFAPSKRKECLVFSVTLTPPFRSTDLGEPIKYNLFKNLRAKNA